MQFDENTDRGEFTIQGVVLTIAEPFAEGHECKANEAHVLNQTIKENVRNNKNDEVKKEVEEAAAQGREVNTKFLQELIDNYTREYEFGTRGRSVADPIKRRALDIVKARIKKALVAKGRNLKEITTEEMNAAAEEALAANPQIMELAKSQIEAEAAITV